MFRQKLERAMSRNDSLLCVGLDPYPDMQDPEEVLRLNSLIIEATSDLACAFKPNLAMYDDLENGSEVLKRTLDAIPEWIPKIGDAKRGDIANCGEAYRRVLFEKWDFDAATVNPYMGPDAVDFFLRDPDKTALVLCRTSSPRAGVFQDRLVIGGPGQEPRPLYLVVAEEARKWNKQGNVGLVVGATYPDEIREVRRLCPDMVFLIPGVGAQGGDLSDAVAAARDHEGKGFIVNVSRQIMRHAVTDDHKVLPKSEAREAIRREADRLRTDINRYRTRDLASTRRGAAASV